MRNAINDIELALMDFGNLIDLPDLFADARDDLLLSVAVTVGQMRQVCVALTECNRIVNSPEYIPARLSSEYIP